MKTPSGIRRLRGVSSQIAAAGCALIVLSFLNAFAWGDETSGHQAQLNGGYFLLHNLCGEESQVSMLAVIKHTPPEIADYLDRISRTAKESSAALERMQDHDAALRLDQNPLPPIERDVRKSIADGKQHQLLFGTTNSDFVRALLVSQIEASNYAANLAKVLSDEEDDPSRIKTLHHIQAKWEALHDEAYRRLKDI